MDKLRLIPFIFLLCGANYRPVLVNRYECDIIDVTDGDTIRAEIIVPEFNVKLIHQTLRAENYDACESSFRRTAVKITEEEVKIGKLAKEYLKLLCFESGNKIYVVPKGTDVYGRRLCIFLLSKDFGKTFIDIAELMKEKNYLRPSK